MKIHRFLTRNAAPGMLALGLLLAACEAPSGASALPTIWPDEPTPASPLGPVLAPTAGPTPGPTLEPTPGPTEAPPGGYDELAGALRALGAPAKPGARIEQPFLSVPGKMLSVDDQEIQVFEYTDPDARQADSSRITPDGQPGAAVVEWIDQPNFWASGRLIVLYVGRDAGLIEKLSAVLGEPLTRPAPPAPEGAPAAVQAAIQALAEMKGLDAGQITLVSYRSAEWRDSCLGVSRPTEMCAQVITPGYLVLLEAEGAQYELHTDSSGSSIRLRP